MTQEQLMKVKIKYLEDRLTTMEKSIERLHKIVGTMDRYKQSNDPFIKVMEQGEKDDRHKDIDIYESVGGGFDFDDEPKSKDNDNELI